MLCAWSVWCHLSLDCGKNGQGVGLRKDGRTLDVCNREIKKLTARGMRYTYGQLKISEGHKQLSSRNKEDGSLHTDKCALLMSE